MDKNYIQTGTQNVQVTFMKLTPRKVEFCEKPGFSVKRTKPSLDFYRLLFDEVGGEYNWTSRKLQSDQQVQKALDSENTAIFVLYSGSKPAGFLEFTLEGKTKAELLYFGLFKEHHGQGLGKHLLSWGINWAFDNKIETLWLHTSSADSTNAIPLYEKFGFKTFKVELQTDPILKTKTE